MAVLVDAELVQGFGFLVTLLEVFPLGFLFRKFPPALCWRK